MTIPRPVLLTSPKPPGEPGTLYVSLFIFSLGRQLIHLSRPTPNTAGAASNEVSSITLCVSAVNMNLSSPSTVTHKTNLYSTTSCPPRHLPPTLLVAFTHAHSPWSHHMTPRRTKLDPIKNGPTDFNPYQLFREPPPI